MKFSDNTYFVFGILCVSFLIMLRCCFVAISNLRLTASAECYKRFHDHCYTTKQTFENLTWKIPLVIKLACRFNSIHTNCSYSSYQQRGKNVAQQQQKQNKSRKLKKKKTDGDRNKSNSPMKIAQHAHIFRFSSIRLLRSLSL